MRSISPKRNWIIDAVLLVSFLLTYFLDLTGVDLHQWIGVLGAALAGYHLLVHWNWVKTTLRRLFTAAGRRSWLYALLDSLVFISLLGILASGLVISTWLNLSLGNYLEWRNLHVLFSVGTLAVLLVKIGLHWRWILGVARRFGKPAVPAVPILQPATQPESRYTRRQFIQLMGGVGLVSFLAAANGLDDLIATGEAAQSATSGSAASTASSSSGRSRKRGRTSPSASSAETASSTTGCVVQCNRNCSFPGQCRRYVDTNGNNRCDLSECINS